MSYSYTLTETKTFTITHARHIAAKVVTDLKRLQRFYGEPSNIIIAYYEAEIIELLKGGYLKSVIYGFQRNGNWIEPTLQYTAQELADSMTTDDDPGRVRPGADVRGAFFYSYLTYSSAWDMLTAAEKVAVQERLPIQRSCADEPGINGYFSYDRVYSSGGRALNRASLRSLS